MIQNFTSRERKRIRFAGSIVLLVLLLWIVLAPNGVLQYYRLTKKLDAVRTRNQELTAENTALRQEIHRLKNDPAYIEEIARKKYGLLKKNEIIFEFKSRKKRHH